jgi:CRP/FNR family transcriptional regulator, cyclic AMP receptor protein
MSRIDFLGYIASATVLATFCMTRMLHLRLLAFGSNILFVWFGMLAHIYPVLILHLVLLPINVTRLIQIGRRVRAYRVLNCRGPRLPLWNVAGRSPG